MSLRGHWQVWILLAAIAVLAAPGRTNAAAVLERYAVRAGATDSTGVQVVLRDPQFGNGTAESRIVFEGPGAEAGGTLGLRVWRTVAPDEITFALLVFRVAVRGYDAAGTLVYDRDLDGFTFGDSSPGDWRRQLRDIPASTVRLAVTFYGNYE